MSSCTLVSLTLLRCPATAASAELAAARPQAAMSVLVKASRTVAQAAPQATLRLAEQLSCPLLLHVLGANFLRNPL